ncbi:ufm1-specific protease 2 [Asbolus verrucosus]|uniref:Probable Ufm1-specific protease 2 n=1 Tax=Asbolus verrucosus TaxID=1661398 RepID=A0A482VVN7_ASBVE|nr:ufm1-specific protease 2 [Asbolus verrucosus]
MTPSLKISQNIVNRLSGGKHSYFGKVYGILAKNNLVVLGLQVEIDGGDGNDLVNSFPAEIYLCGIIIIGDGNYDEQTIKSSLNEVYVTDNPVFINYKLETEEITTHFFVNGQLEKTNFAVISEQEILSQFLHIHLKADVPLTCEFSANAIKESFTNLRKIVASGVMSFGFKKSNLYLLGSDNDNGVVGITGNPSIGELCDESNEPSEGGARRKKIQNYDLDVMKVNMLKKVTKENGVVGGKEHAPLCVLDKSKQATMQSQILTTEIAEQCKTMSIMVPIDALTMVHRQTKIASLYGIIVESAVRHLRLLEKTFLASLGPPEDKCSQPETFHFYPQECGHFITKIYLKNDVSERNKLHQELLLSQMKPFFRRANNFIFKTKSQGGEILINPHEGLKPSDNGGKISLIKGKYSYYHYCQNKMDDNGWGCAYRSLQTLASWFKLQGYTDKDVPTFSDIQKCLVDIGDKPENFVGSKQWIGSTEVGFVLNTLLGITSKILYVSSGEEMATKGPELVSHFENHGSPVMIGGGVLAHTILGVDYNSQSGNLKFLILDPHYTGNEDLHTVQSKGWCGWKSVDFWDKTAYYNMCLPQVPIGI